VIDRRRGAIAVLVACAVLLALAFAVTRSSPVLISTLGVVVVTVGLVLPPGQTAVVAAVALGLAVVLAAGYEDSVFRVINVGVGALLGLGASWSRSLSVGRIERLRAEEGALLASVIDAVVMLDADGRVVRSNDALRSLVPDAAPGTELHPLLNHRRADATTCPGGCALSGRLVDGDAVVVDGEWIGPPGREVPVEYVASPTGAAGVAVSIRDRSERLRVEREREGRLSAEAAARDHQRVLGHLGATLTPTIPDVPGLEMDVCSRPSDVYAPTGGDLLDAFVADDGRLLVILVDALGHGIGTVRDAWKVLYATKSYLTLGLPLDEVVQRAAAMFATDPQPPVATLLAASIDPRTGEVSVAGGGHPPPLVLRGGGTADWLDIPGRGVGTPDPRSESVVTTALAPGDSIVLYTDGLVEARRDVVAGMLGMRATAVALRREPTQGWAQRLVDAVLAEAEAPDDTVVLMVRRVPREGLDGQVRTGTMPADATGAS
jgi:serine phosphatase RsbU (regulator of sigma subunit)/PAS domain-containing protein